jgi:hypothetical protein
MSVGYPPRGGKGVRGRKRSQEQNRRRGQPPIVSRHFKMSLIRSSLHETEKKGREHFWRSRKDRWVAHFASSARSPFLLYPYSLSSAATITLAESSLEN